MDDIPHGSPSGPIPRASSEPGSRGAEAIHALSWGSAAIRAFSRVRARTPPPAPCPRSRTVWGALLHLRPAAQGTRDLANTCRPGPRGCAGDGSSLEQSLENDRPLLTYLQARCVTKTCRPPPALPSLQRRPCASGLLPPRLSHPRVPAEDPGAAGPELMRQQRPIRGEATPVFFIGASLCLARFSVYSASFKNIYILKSQTCAHSTKIIDAERLKTAREAAERGSAGREGRAPPLRQATPPTSVAWEIRRQPEACARPPAQRGPPQPSAQARNSPPALGYPAPRDRAFLSPPRSESRSRSVRCATCARCRARPRGVSIQRVGVIKSHRMCLSPSNN